MRIAKAILLIVFLVEVGLLVGKITNGQTDVRNGCFQPDSDIYIHAAEEWMGAPISDLSARHRKD